MIMKFENYGQIYSIVGPYENPELAASHAGILKYRNPTWTTAVVGMADMIP